MNQEENSLFCKDCPHKPSKPIASSILGETALVYYDCPWIGDLVADGMHTCPPRKREQELEQRIEDLHRELTKERGDKYHAEDEKISAEDTMLSEHKRLRDAKKEIEKLQLTIRGLNTEIAKLKQYCDLDD